MKSKKSKIKTNAKRAEREAARNLLKIDGKPKEQSLLSLMSSTGRIGHLTGIQLDYVSKNYFGETKSSLSLAENPGHRITQEELLKLQKNPMLKEFKKNWLYILKIVRCEEMHGISMKRHAELLEYERKMKGE